MAHGAAIVVLWFLKDFWRVLRGLRSHRTKPYLLFGDFSSSVLVQQAIFRVFCLSIPHRTKPSEHGGQHWSHHLRRTITNLQNRDFHQKKNKKEEFWDFLKKSLGGRSFVPNRFVEVVSHPTARNFRLCNLSKFEKHPWATREILFFNYPFARRRCTRNLFAKSGSIWKKQTNKHISIILFSKVDPLFAKRFPIFANGFLSFSFLVFFSLVIIQRNGSETSISL